MQKVSEQITNLRKAQNKRENDRKELADVVEQEKLIEIKGMFFTVHWGLLADILTQVDGHTS